MRFHAKLMQLATSAAQGGDLGWQRRGTFERARHRRAGAGDGGRRRARRLRRGGAWVDESVPTQPSPYNRTTLDAEASARRVTEAGRVGVALRFALLYGGAEDAFTRDALRHARRGWLPLPGRPEGYVSMVTHDDAARAAVAALEAAPGIYNVVDDEPLTRRALADALGDVLSVPAPKLPPRWIASLGPVVETIARSIRISNRALRAATGWAPEYPSGREGWRAAAGGLRVSASSPAAPSAR